MALPKGKVSKARGRSRRANWKLQLPAIAYLSLSDLALTYITHPAYKQMVLGLVAGITASDIDNFINRLVLDDNLNLVIKKGTAYCRGGQWL